ncbi:NADPH:quinone oxidoreductase family protein [Streptomyces sulphureus]|uniref:NADPH:quinone oxidoreductase family protein n=1 Tax=Streptomyces sulphureus TaxID=47758 RepID=UPI000364C193|nr:NADPH:quinone oxidoreductase family protein [Streptomyces sulphureus]
MRAVVCRAHGAPEDLVIEEVPTPRPGPGEVSVSVRSAAVNFPDVLLVAGGYQVTLEPPFVPGSELAGRIAAVGAGVTRWAPGERVAATVATGAFAEEVVVPAASVRWIPAGTGYAEAAAGGVAYRTAYHALRSVAEVRPGQWVVVLGAAGGVGSAAVELVRRLGGRALAAVSGTAKLELARARGAECAVDYTREDLKSRIRALTGGGADIVLDPVGGPHAEEALRALRHGGTFVTLGYAAGTIPAIPLNLVLLKGVTIRGLEVRTFAETDPEAARRDTEELDALLAEGVLSPHIGARYPLARTAEALREVADRRALGKVVVDVADDE